MNDTESVQPAGSCGANCYGFNVRVPNVPDIGLKIRVTSPMGEPDAWVVLCSGGTGGGFMGNQPGGAELVEAMAAQNLFVLERAWDGGWLQAGHGVKPQSRRGAAMLSFLINSAARNGKTLMAVGNSGGSSELAYSLTTWERYPANTILASGPPMTRLEHECAEPPSAIWAARCSLLLASSGFTFQCGTPALNNPGGFLCSRLLPPSQLFEDSILHSAAVVNFPQPVSMLIGDNDCTAAVCQGLEFQSATGVPVSLVGGGNHFLPETAEGRAAIVVALVSDRDSADSEG